MQKADLTGSGRTTALMAQSTGEDTTTTASGTVSGGGTALMAHWRGESTGTTVSKRGLLCGGILRVELQIRRII